MNTVQYTLTDPDKLEAAVTRLRTYAKTALENGTTTTPLSAAERFRVVQSSRDPTVEALAEIVTRLDDLQALVLEGSQLGSKPARQVRVLFEENGPVVFTRDYVMHTSLSKKTYAQGKSGIVTYIHKGPLGEITHVDIRLKDGEFLRDVPIDYFRGLVVRAFIIGPHLSPPTERPGRDHRGPLSASALGVMARLMVGQSRLPA